MNDSQDNKFENDGDVFYSEGSQNITYGLSFAEIVQLMELGSLEKMKTVPHVKSIIQKLYGKSIIQLHKSGVSNHDIWKAIEVELNESLINSISIENISNEDIESLKVFYKYLDAKEFEIARNTITNIFQNKNLDSKSLSFKLFLEGEVLRIERKFLGAFEKIYEALKTNYSDEYVNSAITIALGNLRRIDLTSKVINTVGVLNENEISLELMATMGSVLISMGKYDEAKEGCLKVLDKLADKDSNRYGRLKIHFMHTYINALIQGNMMIDSETETKILNSISDLDTLVSKYSEDFEITLRAKTKEYNLSALYQKIYQFKFHVLCYSTIHPFINCGQDKLSDDQGFINLNYLEPVEYLEKSINHTNELIRLKEGDDNQINIEVSYANRALLLIKLYRLKDLLAWKIKYVCDKFRCSFEEQVKGFEAELDKSDILKNVRFNIDMAIEKARELQVNITRFIVEVADFFFNEVKNDRISMYYYQIALSIIGGDKNNYTELYDYLVEKTKI
ncbi:hypothetical protein [Neolewinella antarctica]|uniref:Uncharacterized protein n=1 Tax=Neolewinella antarctica TaxID=442734 RepID=A0ABX0XFV1_9BACT|nr:hypothetical protein [Neolewinella antarctica]NJC28010.1 hypothetical protein [Neolewinella antarctica]